MKKQAKIDVLKELMQMAKDSMRDKTKSGMDEMRSAQKVTVAAPDKESLLMGLEKAEDVLESAPEMEESSEEMMSEEKPAIEQSMKEFMEQSMQDDEPMLSKASYEDEDEDDSMFAKKTKKKIMDEE